MKRLLESCEPNGNLIIAGRVEGSQTKGLSSAGSDIDLTICFIEGRQNLLSLSPREILLDGLDLERMRKLDLNGRPVKGHLGYLFEETEVELTLLPLFTKGHLVYPSNCDLCPETLNRWTEARSTRELIPQLYFQNGKALYDLFTAHEAYQRPEWTRLQKLVGTKYHVSGSGLCQFFLGYMRSQLKARENILSFKNFLNVHNVTSSKLWDYMSEEQRKHFHTSVTMVQSAFSKFKKENPVLKGRRWIDFEKRERKALEERSVSPVVKQILEGTYIGLGGIHFFQTGTFHCDYRKLLDELSDVVTNEQYDLLCACLEHKTGKERIRKRPERFLQEIREPRIAIFQAIEKRLESEFEGCDLIPRELTPEMHATNGELLHDYLVDVCDS